MKTLLVVGASGLLGQHLVRKGREVSRRVVGTYFNNPFQMQGIEARKLDVTSKESVLELFEKEHPDFAILSSGLTGVDYCEEHPEEATALNETGASNIATACESSGTRLLYVSTDYVFDGERGDYKEEDDPNPVNIYGRTKLEGERVVLQTVSDSIVARVCVIYGWNTVTSKQNFVTWVLKKIESGETVELFEDQVVTPTYAHEAAEVLLKLVETEATGIYHASGSQKVSRFDIGKLIAEAFDLDPERVLPVEMERVGLPAKRPRDSSLNVRKIEEEFNITMRPLHLSLKHMRENR